MGRPRDRRLEALEEEYRHLLLRALRECASGHWGLFGHNDPAVAREGAMLRQRLSSALVDQLQELGAEIEQVRRRLGYFGSFSLHERLIRARSSRGPNSPGEPKLAQQWLDELAP